MGGHGDADAANGDDAVDAANGDDAAGVPTDPEARDLLVDLVETPSPSGEEAAVADRLVAFFERRGREAFVDGAGNVRAPADDAVLLTSHLDTVAGEIPVRVVEGELWGRGSVDATGPLVAMAVAAVRAGVSFAGVTGEETDSRGARHLLDDRAEPDAVVNGEPGGWEGVTLGYRGLVRCTYRTATPSAHSSRPEPNAVQRTMRWWTDVEALTATFGDSDDPVFERVTATPTRFDGGSSDDGLSVAATVEAEFRLPPGVGAAAVRSAVEGAVGCDDGAAGGDGDESAATVEWGRAVPPHLGDPRSPVARALRAAVRAAGGAPRHVRKTGTSDANLYAGAWDCPVATYGPGDPALDHAPDERLALADFDRAVAVVTDAAERLRDGG